MQPAEVLNRIGGIHPPVFRAAFHPGSIVMVPPNLHQRFFKAVCLVKYALQGSQFHVARTQEIGSRFKFSHRQLPRFKICP